MENQVPFPEDGVLRNNIWRYGLFSCFDDVGDCLLALCCPCVTFGLNMRDSCYPGYWCDGDCGVFSACLAYIFCETYARCAWGLSTRPKIRRDHGIQGSRVLDCLAVTLCPCCALVQERRQLKEGPVNPVVVKIEDVPVTAEPQYSSKHYSSEAPHQF